MTGAGQRVAAKGVDQPGFDRQGDVLALHGALTTAGIGALWEPLLRAAREARVLDLAGVSALDSSGAALVLSGAAALRDAAAAPEPRSQEIHAPPGEAALAGIRGASPAATAVLARGQAALRAPRSAPPPGRLPPIQGLGAWGIGLLREGRDVVAFLGESLVASLANLPHPRRIRFSDLLRHMDEAGLRAFPLTLLLGTLIGIILAFQSSGPLRNFGAELYIPSMVGVSLIRELGPLIAAVILAGRTSSAYAAELGTMTVNEEVDALRIMGIDPMAMLVLPRLLAGMLVMPVLALLMNLSGLAGMMLVMSGLGYAPPLVLAQLQAWLSLSALLGGLLKAAIFGLVIAGIGCRAGLQAGRGPRAVGDAATQAVVGSILCTVLLDGVFAVLFYRLGW